MSPIRVLLVDDGIEFLDAVARFLASDPEVEVVGQTLTGQEALAMGSTLKPDLVLMDLALPDMNGLEVTRQLKSRAACPQVILLTLHDNHEYRSAAKAANVDGFVAKADLGVQLLPLIHTLYAAQQQPAAAPLPSRQKSRKERRRTA